MDDESISLTFNLMDVHEKLHSTIRVAITRNVRGVCAPEDTDTKSG